MTETKAYKTANLSIWLLILLFTVLLILSGSWLVTKSEHYPPHSKLLSLFLTIDIGLIIPLIYYFIAYKKLRAPSVTTLVLFIACLGITTVILPDKDQFYLDKLKYLLFVTELTLLIYGIIKLRSIWKTYAEFALQRNDFVWCLTQTFQKLFGNGIAISIIQSEVQILRYSLFFWKIRSEITPGDISFSIYKKSSYKMIMSVMAFVMLIELLSIHLLLWRFGTTVAVISIILSFYGILFLLGDFIAIIRRPIVVTDNQTVFFRVGLRWNAEIEMSNVDGIFKLSLKTEKSKSDGLNCVLIGNPDCILVLKEPVVVTGYYGIKRVTNKILLSVDESDCFIAEINKRLNF